MGVFLQCLTITLLDQVLHVGDVASDDRIIQLLDQRAVRLKVDGFSDGRGFSVARQLRLHGFEGVIEVIGDLLPDQLPMACCCRRRHHFDSR